MTSIIGKPARTPRPIASRTPFSIEGMNSFGMIAADDVVLEDEARAALAGLDLDQDVAVLAVAAGLPDVLALRTWPSC